MSQYARADYAAMSPIFHAAMRLSIFSLRLHAFYAVLLVARQRMFTLR